MSHEIRTPMNGILGFAGLLKEPKLSGEEQQEYLGIIELLVKNSLISRESIIKTDREKVYAILTNLVKNAIKFTQTVIIELGYKLKSGDREKALTAGCNDYVSKPYGKSLLISLVKNHFNNATIDLVM